MDDAKAAAGAGGTAPIYSRKNPFRTELLEEHSLTTAGSLKDTRHFVLSLAGSGITYTPGDSLAVLAQNPPELVDELLKLLGFPPDAPVPGPAGRSKPLRQVLLEDYVLNRANLKVMGGLAERIPQGEQGKHSMELVDNRKLLN